jgi:hypothetical protein
VKKGKSFPAGGVYFLLNVRYIRFGGNPGFAKGPQKRMTNCLKPGLKHDH